MRVIVLLRGVMPNGKNKIPKMSYLVEILEKEEGFTNVETYIQSGNILLNTKLSYKDTKDRIKSLIYKEIGADLSVILKEKQNFKKAIDENPFNENYDFSRIHLVFTNDELEEKNIEELEKLEFEGEILKIGTECFYMYLPRDSKKKRLNNNFIEKKLKIRCTTRKLSVVKKLYEK